MKEFKCKADWVVLEKKNDKTALEKFGRDCSTKNKEYESLYRDKYLNQHFASGTVVRAYAGCMPYYNPVLVVRFEDGTEHCVYGEESAIR